MANYPEYLERSALIERIKKAYCDGCENYNGVRCRACGIGDAIDVVEDAPTALERTAEWIVQTKIRRGSCAVIAMRETTETATTTARTVVL
jgi:hypothetical protein